MLIDQIRNVFFKGEVEYKAHCMKRMLERDITRKDIESCIFLGEIIEDYPLDSNNLSETSFPSCLIMGYTMGEKVLHVVLGYSNVKIIIISAYYPDLEHWESDYKTRRKQ